MSSPGVYDLNLYSKILTQLEQMKELGVHSPGAAFVWAFELCPHRHVQCNYIDRVLWSSWHSRV